MSEAPHQPSPAAPETKTTLMEPQDQAPTGNSQENSSSSLGSEAVAEFGSSDETLRPSEEIQEEEGDGIDRDVWFDTLPFPPRSLPGLGRSELPRATEDIHVAYRVHASSPDDHDLLPYQYFDPQAERTTSDARDLNLNPRIRDAFWEGSRPESHQLAEDGRRTPPRPSATEAQPGTFDQRLFDAVKTGLLYTLTRSDDNTQPKTAVLNLFALQRTNIHGLQAELARYAAEGLERNSFDFEESEAKQTLLNLYCDAVRNLDFMREKAKLGYDSDPFLIKSSRALERDILKCSGLIPEHLLPRGELPLSYDHYQPLPFNESGGRHHANEITSKEHRLERFAMASFGGLLIIVPMLIMANVPGKVASLVTSCVAIIIFAGLITLRTKLGPHEVLASVAGYAAVLVVFVGLSLEKR